MAWIREKIVEELLHKIEINMDTAAVDNSVAVFSEFIKALVLEADMLNPDTEVDKSAKQQTEAANAHMKDLGILFQLSGDHQKEVDEIFAKIGAPAINEVTQLLDIIKATRKYVYRANFAAEEKHETPGIFYQDSSIYSAMEEFKELLSRIDSVVGR